MKPITLLQMLFCKTQININNLIDITPTVIYYRHNTNGEITVIISNVSTKTVCIPRNLVIAELQPVKIDQRQFQTTECETDNNILEQIHFNSALTKEQNNQTIIRKT